MGRTFISSIVWILQLMFDWSELKVKGYLFVYPQFRSCVSVKTRAETFSTQLFPKDSLTHHTLIKSAPPIFPSQFNQTVCWQLPRNSICLDLVQSRKTGNVKLDWHGLRLEISIPETAKISTPQNSATPRFYQRLKINWCWEKALRKTETEDRQSYEHLTSTLKINVKSNKMIGWVNFTILTCMIATLTSQIVIHELADDDFSHRICLSCGGVS